MYWHNFILNWRSALTLILKERVTLVTKFVHIPVVCWFEVPTAVCTQEYMREQLESQGVQPLPKMITNEISTTDRYELVKPSQYF
jgi:hypothetical protein